jgi:nitrite reductase (NO-forming)
MKLRLRLGLLAPIAALSLAVLVAGPHSSVVADENETPVVATTTVQSLEVVATDFQFTPRTFVLEPGQATFQVRNVGVLEHDFVIIDGQRQQLAGSEILGPGRSGSFDTALSTGTYTVICTIPGHREVGMTAEISVN